MTMSERFSLFIFVLLSETGLIGQEKLFGCVITYFIVILIHFIGYIHQLNYN